MRPALVAAAAAAVLAVPACSSGSGDTKAGESSAPAAAAAASTSTPAAKATGSAGRTSSSQHSPGRPWAEVTLTRTSPEGSRDVSVQLTVRGEVYRSLQGGPEGTPLPGAIDEGSGSEYSWGDGARDGSNPGDVTCSEKGPLIPMRRSQLLQHTYDKPGTYTLTFTQTGCGLPQYATKTLTVTVR